MSLPCSRKLLGALQQGPLKGIEGHVRAILAHFELSARLGVWSPSMAKGWYEVGLELAQGRLRDARRYPDSPLWLN